MANTPTILKAAPALLAFLALLVGGNAQSKDPPASMTSVALTEEDGVTSISIDTDGKAHFGITEIKEPHRILIDVNGAGLGSGLEVPGDATALVSKAVDPWVGVDPSLVIVPAACFEPHFGFDQGVHPDRPEAERYVVHSQEATWHAPFLREVFESYFKLKNLLGLADDA